MNEDRHLAEGGYILDGQQLNLGQTLNYLLSLGFTRDEGIEYLKGVKQEGRNLLPTEE